MAKRLAKMDAMIQQIPRVPTPLKKSQPHSYADSLFVDFITLVEMPKKFSFPNMKLYDDITDLMDYIASYKQCLCTAAIPRELREASMYRSFGSNLIGTTSNGTPIYRTIPSPHSLSSWKPLSSNSPAAKN